VIERAVILATGEGGGAGRPAEEFHAAGGRRDIQVGARVTLDELEAPHLRRVLAGARNLDDAARTLGIDPATLYRKRQKLGLL